uniref:Uncharacterized protein n=1 Tax=Anopheles maculatus TaxID=74869 RepID=A0A182T806_9DIPT
MQSTVQNFREGLWNLPRTTVNSLLLAGTALADARAPADEITREQKTFTTDQQRRDDNNNDGNQEVEPDDSEQDEQEVPFEVGAHGKDRTLEPMNSSVGSLRAFCDDTNGGDQEQQKKGLTPPSTDPSILRVKWQLVPLDQNASLEELSQAI